MEDFANIGIEKVRTSLQVLLKSSPMISSLVNLAEDEGYQLYLVGGFIRDMLLGRRSKDVDFVASKISGLTKSLSRKSGIRSVPIDKKFGTVRLIPKALPKRDDEFYQVDLSPLRGSSIEDDLNQRDFTINSLAIDLSRYQKTEFLGLIDPLDGLSDLRDGRLRVCTSNSPAHDPLRILRAYRLVSTYGFALESQTRELIVSMRQRLDEVAKERIRDELALMLSAPNSASTLRMLESDNIIELLLPECGPMRGLRQNDFHHQDAWNHSLAALEAMESFLTNPTEIFGSYAEEADAVLSQKLAGDRTLEIMLKLGVLIHNIGKPECRTLDKYGAIHFCGHEVVGAQLAASLCSRLHFSNKEIHFISQLVRQHVRAMHLLHVVNPSAKELGRFFRLGPELFWPLIILFASVYSAKSALRSFGGDMGLLHKRVRSWLDFYYHRVKPREIEPPLVSGQDLMNSLHLSPGPVVGKLLRILSELQWEDRLRTREEALQKAAQLLKDWGKGRQSVH